MGGGMSIEMWLADAEDAGVRSELQRKVFEQFRRDPMLDSATLFVDVENRVVTLSGGVRNRAEKDAAGYAARRVQGVRDVRNNIAIVLHKAA